MKSIGSHRRGIRRSTIWAGVALAAAAALAVSAGVVRSKTRQAERDHPPLGQFMEIDGVRLHYIERGRGEPLVLLHGNGAMVEDFLLSGLLDRAAQNYRVIVFDRPGFGHSERPRNRIWTPTAQAELLRKALVQLGVERCLLAAHSWGTLVALGLALEHPDLVRGMVLLSGYYYPSVRLDVPLAATPAIPVIGDAMRYTLSPLLARLLWPSVVNRIFGPSPVPERFKSFPVWMALRPGQLRAAAAESALMIPAAFRFKDRYGELQMPVVIMTGSSDRIVDADDNAGRLHHEIARSELRVVPGAGHMLHYLAPEAIMSAIHGAEKEARMHTSMHASRVATAGPLSLH